MSIEKETDLFTGERFVPGINDTQLTMEHYQRYYSVLPLVKGKTVLDAACGEGYGTALLGEAAACVTGIDISKDAVARAERRYSQSDKVRFVKASVAQLPIEDNSIDVVVSFETIEHVSEDIQNKFLDEISRVLKKDGGVLIMSTPNKEIYSDRAGYHNEFHVKEFYRDEFTEFLQRKFSRVALYDQFFENVCIVSGDQRETDTVYYCPREYRQEAKYYIAIAGNNDITALKLSHVYVNGEHSYNKSVDRILQLQDEVEERNHHLKELDEEILKYRKLIQEWEKEKGELSSSYLKQLLQAGQRAEEAQNLATALHSEKETLLKENNALKQVNAIELETNARITRELEKLEEELIQLKDREKHYKNQVENMRQMTDGRDQEMEDLRQTIRNKEGHIALLLESEREYEREKKSRTYRMALLFRKISVFLLPVNSKRRFIVRMIIKGIRHPRLMLHMINPRRIRNFFAIAKKEGMSSVNYHYNLVEEYENSRLNPYNTEHIEIEKVQERARRTIKDYDKIFVQEYSQPKVSIIIPVYNQFDYTYNCLKSIAKNSENVSYEIIIADDCSTDLTRELGEIAEGIRIIRNQENLRFLLNCNNAAKYAKGNYILFLNNDTQVQENWLQPLVDLMESDPAIGMTGSKLIYPDGSLQEAGGIIWGDGHAWNYGNRQNPSLPEFNYVKEADYISGASIMIRRELWEKTGGFDERYAPAYCEDSDLAFQVRRQGYKVMYQPLSVVVHFEGQSNGTDLNSGIKKYQVENSQKMADKWRDEFKRQSQTEADLFHARDRSQNKNTILIIDHYVPMFDKDAGSRTIWQYINMFVGKGYNVKFMGDNFYPHEPYTTALQQIGVEVLYGPWYAENYKQWIIDNKEHIDFAFLNRPHITEKYIDFLKTETDIKCIYYGCDLHCMRIQREYEICHDEKLLLEAREWKQREFAIMRKTDVNYYPSCVEVEEIHKVDPDIPAKTFDIYVYEHFHEKIPMDFSKREGLLFVGGFGHPPNEDAVIWFAENVYPLIKARYNIPFYVVGNNPPERIRNLNGDGIVIKGFLTDDALEELYHSCRMAVVPLRFGAGVKGKVIEALYYGIPMVTTSIGIEGISEAEKIVEIGDTAEDFAEKVTALYNDMDRLAKTVCNYQDYVRNHCSVEAVWDHIKEDFTR